MEKFGAGRWKRNTERVNDTKTMEQGNDIYEQDYSALKEKLTCYPGITILSVDKEPPEQYVIEYKLFGYGYDSDDQIQMRRRHEVQINLPFGYPHFPPTIKPLTKICHPDVAEHAIRIADYWQGNQSLADLVIHVGDMIRGAAYSVEDAFNDEAAAWYSENSEKLPLAELEYADPNALPEKTKEGSGFPVKLVAGLAIGLMVVVGGGLVVRDKMVVGGGEEQLAEIQNLIAEQNFQQADEIGSSFAGSLKSVIFLNGERESLLAQVQELLESEVMQQGLRGNIEYQGKFLPIPTVEALAKVEQTIELAVARFDAGNFESAVSAFNSAIELAESQGQVEVADNVRRLSAEKRLAYYVDKANTAYSDKEWQQAVELYSNAVLLFEADKRFLSEESHATRGKLVKLQALAQASVFREGAVMAERKKDYAGAATFYDDILRVISRNEFGTDPVLVKVAGDAKAERERLEELDQVTKGSQYLVENFKEIFMSHYPGLYEPGLQSPRIKYLGRNGGNLVFLMSCIELVKRQTNEFRLSYQYNPTTERWSLYREQK